MAFQSYEDYSDIPNGYITKSNRDYDNESELYNVLTTEMYNQWGTPISYYPISFATSADPMLGEDVTSKFTSAIQMQAYFTFPNRSRVYTPFGIISVETFLVYITMDHFDAMTGGLGYAPYTGYTPKIGDVIRNHYRDRNGFSFYEIANVNTTDEQFEQRKHTWTLTCKLYNDQHIFSDPSIASDPIASNTDVKNDIFDISQKIDNTKYSTIYNGSLEPKRSNTNLLGDW